MHALVRAVVVAVIVVAIGTVASQFIIERDKKLKASNDVH